MRRALPLVAAALALAGCTEDRATVPPDPPVPTGVGPRFQPPPHGRRVQRGRPVGRFRCGRPRPTAFGAHVELFAKGSGMVVPAGIGVAPPRRSENGFVRSGRCEYPIRTHAPTGVVEVATSRPVTVGDLFDVWGQHLSKVRLASFRAPPGEVVRAYVGGRLVQDPRAVRLRRHAQIVLAVGPRVPVHDRYLFP